MNIPPRWFGIVLLSMCLRLVSIADGHSHHEEGPGLQDANQQEQHQHQHHGTFTQEVLEKEFHQTFSQSCSAFSSIVSWHQNKIMYPGINPNRALTRSLSKLFDCNCDLRLTIGDLELGEKYLAFSMHEKNLRNGGLGDRLSGLVNAATIALRFNRTLLIRSEPDMKFGRLFRPYIAHYDDPASPSYNAHSFNVSEYTYDNFSSWTNYDYSWNDHDDTEYDLWNCINHSGKQNPACSMEYGDVSQPVVKLRSNRAFLCYHARLVDSQPHKDLEAYGINDESDLHALGGCLLRLHLWPTEYLWHSLDEAIESHNLDLKRQGLISHESHDISMKWQYLVSTHFRCGDAGYLGRAGPAGCMLHLDDPNSKSNFIFGNPYDTALCAQEVIRNVTASATAHTPHRRHLRSTKRKQNHRRQLHGLVDSDHLRVVAHIASDNIGSTGQINQTLGYPYTIISPNGCHIEMSPTFECMRLTVVYWFLMSFSDSLIGQGDGGYDDDKVLTSSGFTRYAVMYGLKNNSFVDARYCRRPDMKKVVRHAGGNWFC